MLRARSAPLLRLPISNPVYAMCCFSQPVISVSSINIFTRTGEADRQFLVYSMSIKAKENLAMILPLPVKVHVGEKDVEFIDLKGYPNFFGDLRSGFPADAVWKLKRRESSSRQPSESQKTGGRYGWRF
jgi:hypothetical protein